MPKVSVVIPCYNQGLYLKEAVDSVLEQSFRDFEIVIVNDGSFDSLTLNTIDQFRSNRKIRVIDIENSGLPSARNMGIDRSQGEYILALDGDDKIDKRYLRKTVKVLDENPEAGIAATWVKTFGEENDIWKIGGFGLIDQLSENNLGSTCLFRKVCWKQVGGYKKMKSMGFEDWDFWISILETGWKYKMIEEALYHYRIRSDSMLKTMSDIERRKLIAEIVEQHRKTFIDNFPAILAKKEDQIIYLKNEADRNFQAFKQMETALRTFHDSFFWRLTSPLRRTLDWLRKIRALSVRGILKRILYSLPVAIRRRLLYLYRLSQNHRWKLEKSPSRLATSSIHDGATTGLISIVLPVYNHAHHLKLAIEGVLSQTYQHFELIIVNDGSTDNFHKVVEEYAYHPKIRIFDQQNLGLPHALTNGFRQAKGQYCTWTSADNIMLPNQLKLLYDFMERNMDTQMVYSNYRIIDDKGKPAKNSDFCLSYQSFEETDLILTPNSSGSLNERNNFIGPSFLYRSYVAKVIGPYSGELTVEDYDYWLRIHSQFRISHLDRPDAPYLYRVHDDSLSARAFELKIHQKVAHLVQNNQKRIAFIQSEINIYTINLSKRLGLRSHAKKAEIFSLGDIPSRFKQSGKNVYLIENPHKLSRNMLDRLSKQKNPSSYLVAYFTEPIAFSNPILADLPFFDLVMTSIFLNFGILRSYHDKIFMVKDSALLDFTIIAANGELAGRIFARGFSMPPAAIPYLPRRVNVVFETKTLDKGGLETALAIIANHLDSKLFNPVVVVTGKCGLIARNIAKNIPVNVLNKSDPVEHYRTIIKQHQTDLIYSFYSEFSRNYLPEIDIPIIESVQNTYSWFNQKRKQDFLKNSDRVSSYIASSAVAADYLVENLEIDPTKISIIPNPYDAGLLAPNPMVTKRSLGYSKDDFILLNVASVYPPKAQLLLIKALSMVRESKIKVIIVGDILEQQYYDLCLKTINKLKLQDRIRFIPYNSDIASYYKLANVFVLPSYVEGWSLAANEAASFGLPLILSRAGGATEMVPNKDYGWTIPNPASSPRLELDDLLEISLSTKPSNAPQLAKCIKESFDNRNLWTGKREKIREHVAAYNIDNLIKLHEKVIYSNLKPNK